VPFGARGQAFLKEMLVALDSLPAPRLIDGELEADGEACALGSVGKSRGIEMAGSIREPGSGLLCLRHTPALAAEIMYINDEAAAYWIEENPEQRWWRVREWVARHIAR